MRAATLVLVTVRIFGRARAREIRPIPREHVEGNVDSLPGVGLDIIYIEASDVRIGWEVIMSIGQGAILAATEDAHVGSNTAS